MTGLDRYAALVSKPRRAPRAKPVQHEAILQRAVIKALTQAFPETYFFCVNNNSRSRADGARMKAMGVKPGVPDIGVMPVEGGVGWLELKHGPITASSLSKEQADFMLVCRAHEIKHAVVNSVEGALDAVTRMKGLRV